ncbi:HNH endonuclease [Porphyromonas sp. COT-239 OH1446]|uniref:HNH endonuclease n=1 Tax=Porphyromonas sp. COT-239 OH1446 TaxID=1515613 RepID=UPI00052B839D|nr:HNH endonuclease [Porphyromonas sp. COT-239 OH1446]KGN68400.1 hypothetical protein HQ37_06355 [Porphyromonas sp. COT-239 OH1446]
MIIDGKRFKVENAYDTFTTVPDCWVTNRNKLGKGNGEAKIYLGNKQYMREFYGGEGFAAKVILLKSDLIAYMNAMKFEYMHPSQNYRGGELMPSLWQERMDKILEAEDIIEFTIYDQTQIVGDRGYVNTSDPGYQLIRELSLPLVSFISAMELRCRDKVVYYWKLFADFDAIAELKNGPLVFKYGHAESIKSAELPKGGDKKREKKDFEIASARVGQGQYREGLLQECPYCPITGINDERLLIASHIKPWVLSDDREKVDPKNGLILSPVYDKLFDRGFITFTNNRRIVLSNWISPENYRRIGVSDNKFFQRLPLDDERCAYLDFHRQFVFKGIIDRSE